MSSQIPVSREQPILAELAGVGYETSSLAELRHSGVRYREAIPVLLSWLPRVTERGLREQLVRALTVPWARPEATLPMIEEFRRVDESVDPTGLGLRWTIGNAIEVLAVDSVFDELVELATDRSFGRSRQMVVLGLGRLTRPAAVGVLLGLVDDPDVDGHALRALVRIGAPAARGAFERKLHDDRAWVRNTARRGLAKPPQQLRQ